MKRSIGLSQVVLQMLESSWLSRVLCTLLSIVALVAPGAAQSVYVDNGSINSAYVAEYAPSGATLHPNLLSFGNGNMILHDLTYSGGYLYVPVDANQSTINKYNANTAAPISSFNFTGSPHGIAVFGNLVFVAGGTAVGVYNATTGATINPVLASLSYPQHIAVSPGAGGNVNVFVTCTGVGYNAGSIQKLTVSSAGGLISGPTPLVANLNLPQGIAVSANGQTVYVVIPNTYNNNAVGEIDAYNTTSGSGGVLVPNMSGTPWGIALSGSNLMITLNTANAVGEYNVVNQVYFSHFITTGLNHPTGITIGSWFLCHPCKVPGPWANLAPNPSGRLYGTTTNGGIKDAGTAFEITAAGKLTTLHSFDITDGANPYAGLTLGINNEFYGTTLKGGGAEVGTVFEMSSSGALKTLHSFDGKDGANPYAALVQGSNGSFYGTTLTGGSNNVGTVFGITPSGKLTMLHSFSGVDGANPYAGLIQSPNGIFYGTTYAGGANGDGTIFQLSPSGALTTLYNFCAQTGCADGASPIAGLVQGADGNFYGTTYSGGANNGGTIFQLSPNGTLTTLYSLCSQGGSSCTDGQYPSAALIQGNDGNFYGTTTAGGAKGLGTIFNIDASGTLTTFYSFDGTSGASPEAALMQYFDGTFYGTAAAGKNGGAIFNLSAGLPGFVKTSPTSGNAGTKIKILGAGLSGATSVMFNGAQANFKVVSNFEITTTVPQGATTGPVQVVTPNGIFSSAVPFQVPSPACSGGSNVVIYNNLGSPTDAFDYTNGWLISGPNSPLGNQQWLAYPFTPTGNHTATEIDAAAFYYSGDGQGGNSFNFGIWSDAGGVPGAELNGTDVSNLPTWTGSSGDCCNTQNAAISATPLTAGTQYWVVLSTDGNSTDSLGAWDNVYNDAVGLQAYNVGSGWSTEQATTAAFAVCGSN